MALKTNKASFRCGFCGVDSTGTPLASQYDFPAPLNPQTGRMFAYHDIFDDFVMQTFSYADTAFVELRGSDQAVGGLATYPTIVATQECGVIRLLTGDASGTFSAVGSQITSAVKAQADSGGLIFETRLHINSAITGVSVNAGFTDLITLEEPVGIDSSDDLTTNAADLACFVYDASAGTKEWFAVAVDTNDDDVNSGTTGIAPAADTWQTLRIEVNAAGDRIQYFINGKVVKVLEGGFGVSPDVDLHATVSAGSTTTAAKQVDIDYIYVGYLR